MIALRAAVMSSFSLTVAVTVWSLVERGNRTLQIVHTAIATLMFLLIALYLYKSAHMASLMVHRELRVRMTVDPDAGFIEYVKRGTVLFNACAGALAKSGIYVKDARSLTDLASAMVIAAEGNSVSREGYGITKSTLAQIGIGLSDDPSDCPVRIVLGKFVAAGISPYAPVNADSSSRSCEADGVDGMQREAGSVDGMQREAGSVDGTQREADGVDGKQREAGSVDGTQREADSVDGTQREADANAFPCEADFALTSDKVTHVLTAYYMSRIYAKYIRYARASLICALAAAAALLFFRQIMYSAAVFAVWTAFLLILVRQVEKRTTRMTFAMIIDFCR